MKPRRNGPWPVTSFPNRRAQIIASIESDKTAKEVAAECRISERNIHRVINNLGYPRMYVSVDERTMIMDARKLRGKTAA